MTALAGYWSWSARPGVQTRCEQMLSAERLYAPGTQVCWSGDGLALGRGLFPLLPEDVYDRGPVEDGDRVLVADIRLDNRAELCAELRISDRAARTMADAELLMRALARWDEDALDRLVGDFAFAFWNCRERKLLLARDPLGQRPLVFHAGADFFAFSSMPRGLHALAEIPRKADTEALAGFLAMLPEEADETFFEGIRKVRTGHLVTVVGGKVSSRRYWNPPRTPLRLANGSEYEQAIREQLDRAVKAQLRGAGDRVGAHLSGGLDSSAVAATAARALGGRGSVVAYTSVPGKGWAGAGLGDGIADEGPLAALAASLHPNMEHVLIAAGGESPLAVIERAVNTSERPIPNACNGVWFDAILQDARERKLTVMLTGQCGNLGFSYDGIGLLGQMLRDGRMLALAGTVLALMRNGTRAGTVAAQMLGPFLPSSALQLVARLRGQRRDIAGFAALHPAMIERMTERAREVARGFAERSRDPVGLRLWALEHFDFGDFNKGVLGGWGIDLRDPTADRRLVELSLVVPAEQFLAAGVRRSLARRAFSDRLPQALLNERRKGYQAADWHEGLSAARFALADEVERIAAVPGAAALLDLERIRGLLEAWPREGWHEGRIVQNYRMALLRGASAGHFLRRAAEANA